MDLDFNKPRFVRDISDKVIRYFVERKEESSSKCSETNWVDCQDRTTGQQVEVELNGLTMSLAKAVFNLEERELKLLKRIEELENPSKLKEEE